MASKQLKKTIQICQIKFLPNVVSSRRSGAPTTVRQMRYMSRKASPPCWITAMGRDLVEKELDGDNGEHIKIDGDQSECVEIVKAQQEARKSDPRGHEDRRSRGFGDTRPARELPWLTSPPPEQGGHE